MFSEKEWLPVWYLWILLSLLDLAFPLSHLASKEMQCTISNELQSYLSAAFQFVFYHFWVTLERMNYEKYTLLPRRNKSERSLVYSPDITLVAICGKHYVALEILLLLIPNIYSVWSIVLSIFAYSNLVFSRTS